ncbi:MULTISPECIES: hypothetical protein [Nocardia]|uniref:hypothetical protein n=1 Tax=Nocardia TaxID=1817 RepID=UPI00245667DA|nr:MULTISPECIES: hypothetical protein [Nocardia]
MPHYRIHGASDDLAIVETADGFSREVEEYDAYHGAAFHIVSRTSGQLRVCLDQDAETGCWTVALGPVDETKPVPAWPIRLEPSPRDYSPRLVVDAPDDARLHEVTR